MLKRVIVICITNNSVGNYRFILFRELFNNENHQLLLLFINFEIEKA